MTNTLEKSHPAFESLSLIFDRTLARCRKTLEKLFRVRAFEVIESVIEYWNTEKVLVLLSIRLHWSLTHGPTDCLKLWTNCL